MCRACGGGMGVAWVGGREDGWEDAWEDGSSLLRLSSACHNSPCALDRCPLRHSPYSPSPSVNTKGWSRSRLLSNLVPSSSVPT